MDRNQWALFLKATLSLFFICHLAAAENSGVPSSISSRAEVFVEEAFIVAYLAYESQYRSRKIEMQTLSRRSGRDSHQIEKSNILNSLYLERTSLDEATFQSWLENRPYLMDLIQWENLESLALAGLKAKLRRLRDQINLVEQSAANALVNLSSGQTNQLKSGSGRLARLRAKIFRLYLEKRGYVLYSRIDLFNQSSQSESAVALGLRFFNRDQPIEIAMVVDIRGVLEIRLMGLVSDELKDSVGQAKLEGRWLSSQTFAIELGRFTDLFLITDFDQPKAFLHHQATQKVLTQASSNLSSWFKLVKPDCNDLVF